jgi:lysophospholipase L1-like esterase
MFEAMPNRPNEIVFLGNSITSFCNWNELFEKPNIKNRGIAGDVINGIISRLEEVVRSKPEKIFLMIGTNDLGYHQNVQQILLDYEQLVQLILTKSPKTTLYLQSILPIKNIVNRSNKNIIEVNNGIAMLAQKHSLVYINLFDLFKTENNDLNMNLSYDGLHLNGQGYLVWKEAIKDFVEN